MGLRLLLAGVSLTALVAAAGGPALAASRGAPVAGVSGPGPTAAASGAAAQSAAAAQQTAAAAANAARAHRASRAAAVVQQMTQQTATLRAQARNAALAKQQAEANYLAQSAISAAHNKRAGDALNSQLQRMQQLREGSLAAESQISDGLRRVKDGLLDLDNEQIHLTTENGNIVSIEENGEEITGLLPEEITTWINAEAPSQIKDGEAYIVTIDQTGQRAITRWTRFDIGENTKLVIDQDAPDWSMLARVTDPSGIPSQIRGSIEAPGELFIINKNGIIFTRTSQINVNSFLASTVDIGESNMTDLERDQYFLSPPDQEALSFSFKFRLKEDEAGNTLRDSSGRTIGELKTVDLGLRTFETDPVEVARLLQSEVDGIPRYVAAAETEPHGEADAEVGILVEPGARIATPQVEEGRPLGRVVLGGPIVENRGEINTPDGQVILAGARNFTLFNNDLLLDSAGPDAPARAEGIRGAVVRVGLVDNRGFQLPALDPDLAPGEGLNATANEFEYAILDTAVDPASPLGVEGRVMNSGVITAPRGNITVVGANISNEGVLHSTTAVNAEGSILVSAQDVRVVAFNQPNPGGQGCADGSCETLLDIKPGQIRFAPESTMAILPDRGLQADGTPRTIPAGTAGDFVSSFVRIDVGNGRVETAIDKDNVPPSLATSDIQDRDVGVLTALSDGISFANPDLPTVGLADFMGESLLYAPSGSVIITTANNANTLGLLNPDLNQILDAPFPASIVIREGAAIDVSGLMDIQVPVSDNVITTLPIGLNELADVPTQRDGPLLRAVVTIDRRITGETEDGRAWVGSPLFDASGFVDAVGLPVEQVMIDAGTIEIVGVSLVDDGADIGIAGGHIAYQGGEVRTTNLLDTNGRTVNIALADPFLNYAGIAEPQPGGGQFEAGYLHGGHAGRLVVSGASAPTISARDVGVSILEGDIRAAALRGPLQRQDAPVQGPVGADVVPPVRGDVRTGEIDLSRVRATTIDFAADDFGTGILRDRFVDPGTGLNGNGQDQFERPAPMLRDYVETPWSTDRLSESGAGRLSFANFRSSPRTNDFNDVESAFVSASSLAPETVTFHAGSQLILPPGPTFGGEASRLEITAQTITLNGRETTGDGREARGAEIYAPGGDLVFNLQVTGSPKRLPAIAPDEAIDDAAVRIARQAAYQSDLDNDANRGSFTLSDDAVLDVSGLWVNDAGASRNAVVGSDFIDAGSITFTTTEPGDAVEALSTIAFAEGSLVNLSSGGYVNRNRQFKSTGRGVPAGKGGDLTILFQDGGSPVVVPVALEDPDHPGSLLPPGDRREQIDDELRIAGQVLALGFEGGGTFTLRAPAIVIGEDASFDPTTPWLETVDSEPGMVRFDPQDLQLGFGAYDLTGLTTSTIEAGTLLVLQQPQWQPTSSAVTANSIFDAATVGFNSDRQATPVDFALRAEAWTDHTDVAVALDPATPTAAQGGFTTSNALVIGADARIRTDPGGNLTFEAVANLDVRENVEISAPGGSITLDQGSRTVSQPFDPGGTRPNEAFRPFDVSFVDNALWLRPGASLSADGTFVADPLSTELNGDVLDAGTVSLTANVLIAEAGSGISVNGATEVLRPARSSAGGARSRRGTADLTPFRVDGDAGSISINVAGSARLPAAAYIASDLSGAEAAGSSALGGTLSLETATGSSVQLLAQTPEGLSLTPEGVRAALENILAFGADRLARDDFESGIVGLTVETQDLAIQAAVQLALDRYFIQDMSAGGQVRVLEPPAGVLATEAVIRAPYIGLIGAEGEPTLPAPASPTVPVGDTMGNGDAAIVGRQLSYQSSGLVDIAALVQVDNTVEAPVDLLISAGQAVRFVPTATDTGTLVNQAALVAPGKIEIQALQVFPETGTQGVILTPGEVTISRPADALPGAAQTPFSAGGGILISARAIINEGDIRAPQGTLRFGITQRSRLEELYAGPTGTPVIIPSALFSVTERVEFAAGGVASVASGGQTLPFGYTVEQQDWFGVNGAVIFAPPEKRIAFDVNAQTGAADALVVLETAEVDLAGGGEVYAIEFVPGLGGSRNVLIESTTTDDAGEVYAILPGARGTDVPYAALDPFYFSGAPVDALLYRDPDFASTGLTLTTDVGIPGLPAGTYTLYAGRYASVPGAIRVQRVPGSENTPPGFTRSRQDGTGFVTGTRGFGATATGGRPELWAIQPDGIWQQYSEIIVSEAAPFFTAAAVAENQAVPRLPVDGGRLAVEIIGSLSLNGRFLFVPAPGGRGGEVDIAVDRIAITADGEAPVDDNGAPRDGFLVLTPDEVEALEAESVLLGGLRFSGPSGDRIEITAQEVFVRTTDENSLEAGELILAAREQTTIAESSVILSVDDGTGDLAPDIGFEGEGALIVVSNDLRRPRDIGADSRGGDEGGVAEIGENAILGRADGAGPSAGERAGSILIEATGETRFDGTISLGAERIDVTADTIEFVGAGNSGEGAVIGDDLLVNLLEAADVTLRARTVINFSAPTNFVGEPDQITFDTPTFSNQFGDREGSALVRLGADTVILTNSFAGSVAADDLAPAVAALEVVADTLILGGNGSGLDGLWFRAFASNRVVTGDSEAAAEFIVKGDIALVTPLVEAGSGTDFTLRAVGEGSKISLIEAFAFTVAQESRPDAGDFDTNILGVVTPFETTDTAFSFYFGDASGSDAGQPGAFSGPDGIAQANTTSIFLLQSAEGLSLGYVHDAPGDGTPGAASLLFTVAEGDEALLPGIADPAQALLVADGPPLAAGADLSPGEPNDSYYQDGDALRIDQLWAAGNTDGAILGGIDPTQPDLADLDLLVEYAPDLGRVEDQATPAGLDTRSNPARLVEWRVVDAGGEPVVLEARPLRRGRLRLTAEVIPVETPELTEAGGRLAFDAAGAIDVKTTVAARAGIADLRARDGNLVVEDGGEIVASGFSQTFVDKTVVGQGGTVSLQADRGNVVIDSAATGERAPIRVDAAEGGDAGTVRIATGMTDAGQRTQLVLNSANLAEPPMDNLIGEAPPRFFDGRGADGVGDQVGRGSGGSFFLDTAGRVDLLELAPELVSGGFIRTIDIRSGNGDLRLGVDPEDVMIPDEGGELPRLDWGVRDISLAADGGLVAIGYALINASTPSGGSIELYGRDGVYLAENARLRSINRTDPDERAENPDDPLLREGAITIGVGPDGVITLVEGSQIEARAMGEGFGAPDPSVPGGTIRFRLPFDSVLGAGATGEGRVVLGPHVFDADFGDPTAIIFEPYEQIDIGDADADARVVNTPGVIRDFPGANVNEWDNLRAAFDPVEKPEQFSDFVQAASTAFSGQPVQITPGLELINGYQPGDPANSGDITINASVDLSTWRFDGDGDGFAEAPGVLSIRAAGDVILRGSISDGFRLDNDDNIVTSEEVAAGELFSLSELFRISQETAPGAGDFDDNVLGEIRAFRTLGDALGFYFPDADPDATQPAAFGGPAEIVEANTTSFFLLQSAEGLSLGYVHDAAGDDTPGAASLLFTVGDGDGAVLPEVTDLAQVLLVTDGPPLAAGADLSPGEPNDSYYQDGDALRIDQLWAAGNTDGAILGGIDPTLPGLADLDVFVAYAPDLGEVADQAAVDGLGTRSNPARLVQWRVVGADGEAIILEPRPQRRGRLRIEPLADLNVQSWTYNITAGARLNSADPTAVAPVTTFETPESPGPSLAERGNVLIGNAATFVPPTRQNPEPGNPLGDNVIIRTGTGDINIAAGGAGLGSRAGDRRVFGYTQAQGEEFERAQAAGLRFPDDASVLLVSPTAVVYTAGVNVPSEPGFEDTGGVRELEVEPYEERSLTKSGDTGGVDPNRVNIRTTEAAFPTRGGDITVTAPNGSVVGQQHYTDQVEGRDIAVIDRPGQGGFIGNIPDEELAYIGQLFTPWLLSQGEGNPTRTNVPEDVFAGGTQSAHWVITGAFQQGIATLGGGDLTVTAGQDVRDISLSIVSAHRATGGKGTLPELVTYGGGALTVEALGDISSIVTLVEEGRAKLTAGGSFTTTYHLPLVLGGEPPVPGFESGAPIPTMIFLGDADVDIQARGTIDLGMIGQLTTGAAGDEEVQPYLGTSIGPAPSYYRFALENVGPEPHAQELVTGEAASIDIVTVTGKITVDPVQLSFLGRYGGFGASSIGLGRTVSYEPNAANPIALPPNALVASLLNDVVLATPIAITPAADGNVDILAGGSIFYYQDGTSIDPNSFSALPSNVRGAVKFIDADPRNMVGPLNPRVPGSAVSQGPIELDFDNPTLGVNNPNAGRFDDGYERDQEENLAYSRFFVHADPVLHRDDPEPSRFIALNGDLISGIDPDRPGDPTDPTFLFYPLPIYVNEPAILFAGGDILNLNFVGQNVSDDSVTVIQAGRDITFDQGARQQFSPALPPTEPVGIEARGSNFAIGGPGEFVVIAGRSIDLKPSLPEPAPGQTFANFAIYTDTLSHGITAIGNRTNPFLARESADVNVLFGVANGIQLDVDSGGGTETIIVPAEQYATPAILTALFGMPTDPEGPEDPGQPGAFDTFFEELRESTTDDDRARAFAAINDLFPASVGYSDNTGAGGQVQTGDLDMINALVRTEFGGEINLVGPGGRALIGPLNTTAGLPPDAIGLLTLRGGDINAFVDDNFDVFASRTGTLQGGNVTIVSSFGDIDAGRGRRTDTVFPRLVTVPNSTLGTLIDFGSLVTGAGIFTTVSVPGAPIGNVFLSALRGTISAGEAGIRSSGNLFLVANLLVNTVNIQASGQSFGVPQAPSVAAPAVSVDVTTQAAQQEVLQDLAVASREEQAANQQAQQPSIIQVEVIGLTPVGGVAPPAAPGEDGVGDEEDDGTGANEQAGEQARMLPRVEGAGAGSG